MPFFLAAAATGCRNSKRECVFLFNADLPPGVRCQLQARRHFRAPRSVHASVWCAQNGLGDRVPVGFIEGAGRALVDVDCQTIDEIRLEVRNAGVRPMVHK